MIMRTMCILTKPVSDVYSGSQIVNIEPKRNKQTKDSLIFFLFSKDIACDLQLLID